MVGRAALAILAVLQLPRLCAGYRLEGQILESDMGQAEASAEVAFAASSSSGKSKGSAAATSAGGARTGADPDPTRAEKDEQCHLAVSGSTWKRNKRCECGEDTMVNCPSLPCNFYGRRFGLEALEGKGCSCGACAVTCEAVPGSKTRASKWKKVLTGRDCECEEGFSLTGESAVCKSRGKDQRYFKAKKIVDRGCSCTNTSAEGEARETESATQTEVPVDGSATTEEAPKQSWEDPKFVTRIVYGGTSVVVLCCFILMMGKVVKTLVNHEFNEEIDYTTTEATQGRRGTEATEASDAPYLLSSKSEQQQKHSQSRTL